MVCWFQTKSQDPLRSLEILEGLKGFWKVLRVHSWSQEGGWLDVNGHCCLVCLWSTFLPGKGLSQGRDFCLMQVEIDCLDWRRRLILSLHRSLLMTIASIFSSRSLQWVSNQEVIFKFPSMSFKPKWSSRTRSDLQEQEVIFKTSWMFLRFLFLDEVRFGSWWLSIFFLTWMKDKRSHEKAWKGLSQGRDFCLM